MMTLHELEEIIIPDYSALASITKEEKLRVGRLAVKKVVDERKYFNDNSRLWYFSNRRN